MTCAVFIATSLDGYIARPDGSFDWLPVPSDEGDPFGYHAFMADVDVLVMGRLSFEAVRGFDPWPYGPTRVVVLSTQTVDVPEALADRVTVWNDAPETVARRLEAEGCRKAYIDGGETIQRFLRAGLIEEMIVTRVPVLIGSGRPLFGPLGGGDVWWTHEATFADPSGLVQSRYRRA